jgi:hypothetical protein
MAYYKLFTDRNENFTAEVSVKNASLKNSIARLIVESDGINLVFNGNINDGKCTIPIKKLRGIMEENTLGKMHLEIIVEGVYFKPWESDFMVEEHTSMKVIVQEQKEIDTKPLVEVKVAEPETQGHTTSTPNTGEVEYLPAATSTPKPEILNMDSEVFRPVAYGRVNEESSVLYPSDELVQICESIGLKKKNLTKKTLHELLSEYFKQNKEFIGNRVAITKQFLNKIK